jgi:hypothetical protein
MGLEWIVGLGERLRPLHRYVGVFAGMAALIWSAGTYYHSYVGPNRRDIFGFYPEATVVGHYMAGRTDTTDFYLTDNFPRDTLTFLTYRGGDPYEKHYTWTERDTAFLDVVPKPNRETVFVMRPDDAHEEILTQLHEKYPDGKRFELPYDDNGRHRIAAWLFTVPSGSPMAARP